jgi:hypothetical protein
MYTIRRHLGNGKHKGHFQIRGYVTDSKQGEEIAYVDPSTHTLEMYECKFYNNPNVAQKILGGKSKQPCAWVICESYEISPKQSESISDDEVRFNPKVNAHWTINEQESDNAKVDAIISFGSKLYKL